VMVDSDKGKKAYRDCVLDYTITHLRELLTILGLQGQLHSFKSTDLQKMI
jgi:hypothetical protein